MPLATGARGMTTPRLLVPTAHNSTTRLAHTAQSLRFHSQKTCAKMLHSSCTVHLFWRRSGVCVCVCRVASSSAGRESVSSMRPMLFMDLQDIASSPAPWGKLEPRANSLAKLDEFNLPPNINCATTFAA